MSNLQEEINLNTPDSNNNIIIKRNRGRPKTVEKLANGYYASSVQSSKEWIEENKDYVRNKVKEKCQNYRESHKLLKEIIENKDIKLPQEIQLKINKIFI